jgi:hypothetical protein
MTEAGFAEHLEKSTPPIGLPGFRYPQLASIAALTSAEG